MILSRIEYIFLRFIKQLSPLKAIHCYAPEGFMMDYLGRKKKKKGRKQDKRKKEKPKISLKCIFTVLNIFPIYFSPQVALIDTLVSYILVMCLFSLEFNKNNTREIIAKHCIYSTCLKQGTPYKSRHNIDKVLQLTHRLPLQLM